MSGQLHELTSIEREAQEQILSFNDASYKGHMCYTNH